LPEPDAVGSKSTIELVDRHEFGPLEAAAMASCSRPSHVQRDGDQYTQAEDGDSTGDGGSHQIGERLIAINPVVQESMKGQVSVSLVVPDERAIAGVNRRVREPERHPRGGRRRCEFVVEGESTTRAIEYVQQPVLAGAREPQSRDEPTSEVR
jgi:hypothetical protein